MSDTFPTPFLSQEEREEQKEIEKREEIERKCAEIYGISLKELRKRILSFHLQSEILSKQEKLIEEYVREIHLLKQGNYEDATNDAFDLGYEVALHDKEGLSWDEAKKKLEEIKEKYKKEE